MLPCTWGTGELAVLLLAAVGLPDGRRAVRGLMPKVLLLLPLLGVAFTLPAGALPDPAPAFPTALPPGVAFWVRADEGRADGDVSAGEAGDAVMLALCRC